MADTAEAAVRIIPMTLPFFSPRSFPALATAKSRQADG